MSSRLGRPPDYGERKTVAKVRRRSDARMAVVTLVVYWGLAGAGLMLRVVHHPSMDVASDLAGRIAWGAYPTVGAVLVARQPGNRIGWLCCGIGLLLGPAYFGQDYAWYALVHQHGTLPGGLAMAWLGQWPWALALGLLVFVLLLFPNGRLPSPRWRPLAWATVADLFLFWAWAAFAPRPFEAPGLERVTNPISIHHIDAAFRLLNAATIRVLALLVVLSLVSIVVRFRQARGVERQQLKWFTYATVVSMVVWVVVFASDLQFQLPAVVRDILGGIWLGGIPVGIGVAVLRYRLYDIDRIIHRTLVYGLLTAVLGLGYGGVVLIVSELLGRDVTRHPPSWVVASATLAVAAVFQPARRRIQRLVDRRFNRRGYDTARTMEAFTVRLRDHVDLEILSTELLAVVDQTMEPTTASLWLRPTDAARAGPVLPRHPEARSSRRPMTA
jgi:hypothetical protein